VLAVQQLARERDRGIGEIGDRRDTGRPSTLPPKSSTAMRAASTEVGPPKSR
jgi:hypothetical protein